MCRQIEEVQSTDATGSPLLGVTDAGCSNCSTRSPTYTSQPGGTSLRQVYGCGVGFQGEGLIGWEASLGHDTLGLAVQKLDLTFASITNGDPTNTSIPMFTCLLPRRPESRGTQVARQILAVSGAQIATRGPSLEFAALCMHQATKSSGHTLRPSCEPAAKSRAPWHDCRGSTTRLIGHLHKVLLVEAARPASPHSSLHRGGSSITAATLQEMQ